MPGKITYAELCKAIANLVSKNDELCISEISFSEFADEYLKARELMVAVGTLSPTTFLPDRLRLKKIRPYFGDKTLSSITTREVDEFLTKLMLNPKKPLSGATRNRYRVLLHSLFSYAVKRKHCLVNPVSQIEIFSEKIKSRKVGLYKTEAERDLYIETAFQLHPMFGVAASILLLSGIRVGELLGLKWECVDAEHRCLHIRAIVEQPSRSLVNRTKGQRLGGNYQAILCNRLRGILDRWRAKARYRKEEHFILHRKDGSHLTHRQYERVHAKVIERSNLPRITIHDLRRTFASLARKYRFTDPEIQQMLGHETPQATKAYIVPDLRNLTDRVDETGFGDEIKKAA